MNISLTYQSDTLATIHIQGTAEDLQLEVKKKLKNYSKNINIKGFRSGRVPMDVLKKKYEIQCITEIAPQLAHKHLEEYLDKNKLNIVFFPKFDRKKSSIDHKKYTFDFYYNVLMYKNFTVAIDANIKLVNYNVHPITDDIIEHHIYEYRKKYGQEESQCLSTKDSVIYGNLTHSKYHELNIPLVLYLNELENSYQKKLLDVKKNDVISIDNLFAIYKNKKFISTKLYYLSKDIVKATTPFQFKATAIKKIKLAEITENFFQTLFPNGKIKSLDECKKAIKLMLSNMVDKDIAFLFEKQVQKFFLQKKIQIPEEYILQNANFDKKKIPNNTVYLNEVRWSIILREISKQEKLNIEEKEVREYIKKNILHYYSGNQIKTDQHVMKNIEFEITKMLTQKDTNFVKNIWDKAMKDKILTHIKKKITLDHQNLTYQEFYQKIKQHA